MFAIEFADGLAEKGCRSPGDSGLPGSAVPKRAAGRRWRCRHRAAGHRGPAAPFPLPTRCLHLKGFAGALSLPPTPRPLQTREETLAQHRIQSALSDSGIRSRFEAELTGTLSLFGLEVRHARESAELVSESLLQQTTLAQSSHDIVRLLQIEAALRGNTQADSLDLQSSVRNRLRQREQILFQRLAPYMADLRDASLLDFGVGNAGLCDLVQNQVSSNLAIVDLAQPPRGAVYPAGNESLSRRINYPNANFDAALAINVLAHDRHKQDSLAELWRVLRSGGKLLVIESLPGGCAAHDQSASMECNFLHDFMYSRIFQGDVRRPIPGLYEVSLPAWERRFRAAGFDIARSEHLGCHGGINPNDNVLIVLSKP